MRELVVDVAGLLLVAARSFLVTLRLMLLLGVVLAAASYYLLAGPHWVYGAIGAAVALVECVLVGAALGAKRAVVVAALEGLRRYQLGSSASRLIFGRLLGVSAEEAHGERGGWLTRTAERLPLAQAEKRLADAVQAVVSAPESGGLTGWLRRRVRRRLVNAAHKYTLARFRDEDARHGGVDLVKVQADLGAHIDGLIGRKLRAGMNLWTAAVLVGLPTQILVTGYIVPALLK